MSREFNKIKEEIEYSIREADLINSREKLLNWRITDYSDIKTIKEIFEPFNQLWGYCCDYNYEEMNIMQGELHKLDRDEKTKKVLDAWADLVRLERTYFKYQPHMMDMIAEVRSLYEEFKPFLPIMYDLLNPALQ